MFFISLAQAQTQTYTLNEELDIKITCLNDGYCSNTSFCNINIKDPDSNLIVANQNMTNQISYHNYTITPNSTGLYTVTGFCKDGSISNEIYYLFLITGDGTVIGVPESLINIFLLLFFIGLLIGFYYIAQKVNFDKWYNSILKKYEAKNIVKMVLSALTFNLMKHSFLIYYLIGFPIMMMATNLAFIYNVGVLFDLMKVLMYIYAWGFIIVGLAFLSYVQEWAIDMLEKIKDMDWGFDE